MKKYKSARECALSLLERQDRTEYELRQKLKEREYELAEIDETLRFLKAYRYIDDAEYAGRYIRTYSAKKSNRRLRCDLERKGVAKEIILQWLEELPVDEETQIRHYLEKKGCCVGEKLELAEYRKLTAALARRGYAYDTIRRVMDRMCDETW